MTPVGKNSNHQASLPPEGQGRAFQMLDIGSESRTLLADALSMCGWNTATIDHNIECQTRWQEAKEHASKAVFISTIFSSDTKQNLTVPDSFDDGRYPHTPVSALSPSKKAKKQRS